LQVIMHELAHRAKNLLSLVEGIARQTAKAEALPESFIRRFCARLAALGGAHDLLIGQDWAGVELSALIRKQLAFVLPEAGERVTLSGPEVMISPQAGQYLALALHELATNATKHGVLGRPEGRLTIAWSLPNGSDGPVELSWREDGALAAAPTRKGFGRTLLETIIPRALAGDGDLSFTPTGVAWAVRFAR
jgi:two-component sensor histidine kinase